MKQAYELVAQPKLLIADGAGTLFDPGSTVPVYGFQGGFRHYIPKDCNIKFDFEPSFDLVMKYMGRGKLQHVQLLLQERDIQTAFVLRFNRKPTEDDIKGIYECFKEQLYPAAARTEEIHGVKEAALRLRRAGIPIIMITGYDRKMVDETRKILTWLDDVLLCYFTNSDVRAGRPAPYLIHRAMEAAGIENPHYAVNVGDTKVDMESADNACMPGIIVTSGSVNLAEADSISQQLGRRHAIFPSLVSVIDSILDGTLSVKLRKLNE